MAGGANMLKHPRPAGPRVTSRTPAEVLAFIRRRCVDDGTCWIWDMATTASGYPNCKAAGLGSNYAHVAAYIAHHGTPPQQGMKVVRTCGDKLCCNPAHLQLASASSVGKTAAVAGAYSTAARRATLAAAARAKSTEQLEKEKEERAKIRAKAEEDAEKEKANAVALVELETGINLAKASGNEELVKTLEAEKQRLENEKEIAKLTAEYTPLVGGNADEAARLGLTAKDPVQAFAQLADAIKPRRQLFGL
jgi:hypothetical protein